LQLRIETIRVFEKIAQKDKLESPQYSAYSAKANNVRLIIFH